MKFFMMDDFRRPLDGNGCWTLGCDPRSRHNGFDCLVSHLSPLSLLIKSAVMTRSNMTRQIDLDSHLMSLFTKTVPLYQSLGQVLSGKKLNEEEENAINFQTGLSSSMSRSNLGTRDPN